MLVSLVYALMSAYVLTNEGGNDAALVDILNQCVFQFFSPTNILTFLATDTPVGDALKAFGVDLGKYSRTCDEQLDFSENLINDPSFSSNIASLIDATKAKLNAGGTLYYTGYAKFWDEAAADGDWCSDPAHTWSISLRVRSQTLHSKSVLTLISHSRHPLKTQPASRTGSLQSLSLPRGERG